MEQDRQPPVSVQQRVSRKMVIGIGVAVVILAAALVAYVLLRDDADAVARAETLRTDIWNQKEKMST